MQQVPGTVFGKAIKWHTWSADRRTTAEVIVPHPTSKSLHVHLFAMASDPTSLEEMKQIAASLKK